MEKGATMNVNVCRVHNPTTDAGARMLKYATRHWAHYRCWLWARVPELPRPFKIEHVTALLSKLHVWQLNEFPVMALADLLESYGIYGKSIIAMKAALKIAKKREA